MKAHEKKKFYRQFCARQLRAGLLPDPASGNWGSGAGYPESTRRNCKEGAHPTARRMGK